MNKEVLYKFVSQLADKLTNEEINDITDYLISLKKDSVKIKVVNEGSQSLPKYETANSAGMDLRANIEDGIVITPLDRALIPTGLHIALPEGYEAKAAIKIEDNTDSVDEPNETELPIENNDAADSDDRY